MIVIFYVCMMVVGAVVLIYAMVSSAPEIALRLTDAWDWWRGLPIYELVIIPLREATGTRIEDYSWLWDPWGAAVSVVLAAILVWAFMRYVPRFITGTIGGK
ncbi:MAG: hypothetical protein O3A21_06520 [Proteobacteria bacterium]|nr:hypothetical protein [Pseudomonadota bacterium]